MNESLKKETLIAAVARAIEKDPVSIEDILDDFDIQVRKHATLAERKRCAEIVESWMEDEENWQPIVRAIKSQSQKGVGNNE